MSIFQTWRRLVIAMLAGCAVAVMSLTASITAGALAPAMAQVSGDFQIALEPYGAWRPHPHFGEVWVPHGLPRDWRPYEYGHWVYTDEWGWYWISDPNEQDWGWVTYHYGRWAFERRIGWFWVPGEDWAPAWVDWRYGDEYVGWAALPPDDLIDAYAAAPALWIFVPGRYMTAPRLRTYIVSPQRRAIALRGTRLVNRTMAVQGARLAVNPGLSPAFVAGVTRAALPTYRVRPRVFAATQGVSGAVPVRADQLRAGRPSGSRGANRATAISVQRTAITIAPAAAAPAPQALGKDERGRLGTHPPRAAQSGSAPQPQAPASQQQPPAAAPPAAATPRPGQRQAPPAAPAAAPPSPPAPSPAAAPPRAEPPRPAPRQDGRRDQRPPPGSPPAARPGEPPPQAKPERPIAPQTPPPPPPASASPRAAPPAASRPAPPSRPVPPAVAPPAPPAARAPPPPPPPAAARPAPPPPAAAKPAPKPGEKPGEKPEDKK